MITATPAAVHCAEQRLHHHAQAPARSGRPPPADDELPVTEGTTRPGGRAGVTLRA